MKPQRKNHVLRGAGIGFGIFLILSALCILTPLRRPMLALAGRETPALQFRLDAQRHLMDSLQTLSSSKRLTPAERASLDNVREAYVVTRERIDVRERMNARFSLLGLFDWTRELFPWLLAFALALPVLGGLVGAQARAAAIPAPRDPGATHPVSRPEPSHSIPVPPNPSAAPPLRPTPPAGGSLRTAYVHPAVAAAAAATAASAAATAAATPQPAAPAAPQTSASRPLPGSPVVLPPDILNPPAAPAAAAETPVEDWGFRHQPTPLESRPRPKMPPVRSSHLTDPLDEDSDENSGV